VVHVRSVAVIAISAALVASLGGCSATSSAPQTPASETPAGYNPVTVTSCGITFHFTRPPTRAVTLQQGATEIMLTLGLAKSMAGTTNLIGKIPTNLKKAYSSVPVLAGTGTFSQEDLLSHSPDFLYSTYGSEFTADQLGTRQELKTLGVDAYLSNDDCQNSAVKPIAASFPELFKQYQDIADIFGVPQRATALIAKQQKVIDQAKQVAKSVKGDPSVLWFYSTYNGTPYVAGGNDLPNNIDTLTHTKNVFSNLTNSTWPEVSWESIADANPDIIVLADLSARGRPGDSAASKLQMLKSDPATKDLKAVKDNHIIVVSGVPLDVSPRSVNVLTEFLAGLKKLGYAS
jgi:iron complex transport system substrate-binding protein